jgi:hypothetical protein
MTKGRILMSKMASLSTKVVFVLICCGSSLCEHYPVSYAEEGGTGSDGSGGSARGLPRKKKLKKKRKTSLHLDEEDYALLEEQGVVVRPDFIMQACVSGGRGWFCCVRVTAMPNLLRWHVCCCCTAELTHARRECGAQTRTNASKAMLIEMKAAARRRMCMG